MAIQVAQTIELSNLSSLHEKILYAEKHRKNYDIFFTVKYDSKWTACYIADAIERVMEGHKALGLTIVQQESEYVFCSRPNRLNSFRSHVPLRDVKLNVFEGEELARYYIDEAECGIEFLIHHLVFDGDSMNEFMNALEYSVLHGECSDLAGLYDMPGKSLTLRKEDSSMLHDYFESFKPISHFSTYELLEKPVYGKVKFSSHEWEAIGSLAQKLRITKFGVILYAIALATERKQSRFGIVISRRNHQTEQHHIGNYTDVVPYSFQLSDQLSYKDNAKVLFKNFFVAIESSSTLTYEEYMNLIGAKGFDLVVSYTRMSDPIAHSEVFSTFVLGDYLYKYDNHTQFNEYEDGLYMEFHYDNTLVKGVCDRLGEMVLELDSINLDEQLSITGQEVGIEKGEVEQRDIATISTGKAQRSSTLQLLFERYNEEDHLLDTDITSFEIAQIITDAYEDYEVQLSYHDIYTSSTIRELKQKLNKKSIAEHEDGTEASNPNRYHLPNFLKTIFIDSFRFINTDMYNVSYALRLTSRASSHMKRVKAAIEQVIQGNDIFFTSFEMQDGQFIASVTPQRQVHIEEMDVEELSDLQRDQEALRIHPHSKLWDFKLVHLKSTGDMYLYFNIHHLLIDHMGIQILKHQITECYNYNEPVYSQYSSLAEEYTNATFIALKQWESLLPYKTFYNPGKSSLGSGYFHKHHWNLDTGISNFEETELRILQVIHYSLSRYFNYEEGYIGAVYHGRVIARTSQIIGSFARVLPLFFSTTHSDILKKSLHIARMNQAVSLMDLNEHGFNLSYPRVVFQTLQEGEEPEDSSIFDQMIEFDGLSKFQIFVQLRRGGSDSELSLYIDSNVYDSEEERRIVVIFEQVLRELQGISMDGEGG
ncbi:condensation domain-containing protein [Paenibacillus amylolyticus]|nr:condensation domain-containing protein [Paenibacillus amylolyticus]WFR62907.1 condensation domain-containing protein [Paenibacillus amylolyticus]